MEAERGARVREIGIVALVSAGHFWSHFFALAIPLALPLIREDLNTNNVSLGIVMAAFALTAAGLQFPMGILTDRFGARSLLIAGLAIESIALMAQGLAPSVPVMIGLALLMGIADSVFHPADYTILTAKIREPWLGRAYSVHTFSGFLGFAVAPIVMTLLLTFGSWRYALAIVGGAGLVTALLLLASGRLLSGVTYAQGRRKAGDKGRLTDLLLSPAVTLMLLFYVFASFSTTGLQGFGNTALMSLYELDLVAANSALGSFLWGTAIGVLAGGVLADRMKRFDSIATVCYVIGALLLCLIGLEALSYVGMAAALFFTGFVVGAVMPARDLMVRAIAPPGATGKVFGYVSSGLGFGLVIGPPVYGRIMDVDVPHLLFFISAASMIAVIATAVLASRVARRNEALAIQA